MFCSKHYRSRDQEALELPKKVRKVLGSGEYTMSVCYGPRCYHDNTDCVRSVEVTQHGLSKLFCLASPGATKDDNLRARERLVLQGGDHSTFKIMRSSDAPRVALTGHGCLTCHFEGVASPPPPKWIKKASSVLSICVFSILILGLTALVAYLLIAIACLIFPGRFSLPWWLHF